MIRAYGFYGYSPEWSVFLDQLPLTVALIWPVVIHSARDLAHAIGARRVAVAAAALVFTDAALIEPVAVQSGLWTWFEPGFFGVPLIGVIGWAVFAGVTLRLVERSAVVVILAPAAITHLVLLASWWGGLRWVSAPIPDPVAVAVAWTLSVGACVAAYRSEAAARVPLVALLLRVPAAGFFFVLLARHGDGLLVAFAVAFVPPYLLLTSRAASWWVSTRPSGPASPSATPP